MKWLFTITVVLLLMSCESDKTPAQNKSYHTRNVVLIVIDGPRYTETWGDTSFANIPFRASMMSEGVRCSEFYNNGVTFTNPGHLAITCGYYEGITNNGSDYPSKPGMLQYYQRYLSPNHSVALVASKDKLHVLTNCDMSAFKDHDVCFFDCGVNGNGTGGYRSDSITFVHLMDVLAQQQPRLTVVNFKEPDSRGHANDSLGYIAAIQKTDWYVQQVWNYLQSTPFYANKTTLIVTNDHGRHTAGWSDGFVSHGDQCNGCKHIEFFALSPDFKSNYVSTIPHEQIDIVATIDELFHGKTYFSQGKVMWDLFK